MAGRLPTAVSISMGLHAFNFRLALYPQMSISIICLGAQGIHESPRSPIDVSDLNQRIQPVPLSRFAATHAHMYSRPVGQE